MKPCFTEFESSNEKATKKLFKHGCVTFEQVRHDIDRKRKRKFKNVRKMSPSTSVFFFFVAVSVAAQGSTPNPKIAQKGQELAQVRHAVFCSARKRCNLLTLHRNMLIRKIRTDVGDTLSNLFRWQKRYLNGGCRQPRNKWGLISTDNI